MKTFFLFSMAFTAGLLLVSCADISKGPATTASNTSMPPGTSPGLSSGGGAGGGGGGFPLKQQP